MVGSVPRLWQGSTVVCLGSGPSLTLADVERVRTHAVKIIAVNDAINFAPWADVLYAADVKWWQWYPYWTTIPGLRRFTTSPAMRIGWPTVTALTGLPSRLHLSLSASALVTGGSGGYGAVNLAVLFGATRIILLGYDMMAGADGANHFFGEHSDGSHLAYSSRLKPWPALAAAVQRQGVTLLNASRRTALPVPQESLDVLFPDSRRLAG